MAIYLFYSSLKQSCGSGSISELTVGHLKNGQIMSKWTRKISLFLFFINFKLSKNSDPGPLKIAAVSTTQVYVGRFAALVN